MQILTHNSFCLLEPGDILHIHASVYPNIFATGNAFVVRSVDLAHKQNYVVYVTHIQTDTEIGIHSTSNLILHECIEIIRD